MIDGEVALIAEENPRVVWILPDWNVIQYWAALAAIPVYYLARIIQSRGWEIINILDRAADPSKVCLDAAANGFYDYCCSSYCDCRDRY